MPHAHGVESRLQQFFKQIIDRDITGRRSQDAFSLRDGLANNFDEHRRLPRSRRTVHQRHVLRRERFFDGLALIGI